MAGGSTVPEWRTERTEALLPFTPETLAEAKEFLFARWVDRAAEQPGRAVPADMSGACKLASLFAREVFGGRIEGNWFHQFTVLADGTRVDLCEDAADVAALREGVIPDYCRALASYEGRSPHRDVYHVDRRHMRNRELAEHMATFVPRLEACMAGFRQHVAVALDGNVRAP